MIRNLLDRIAAAAGLVFLSPLLLIIAAAIVLSDGFPVWFRQSRVGLRGRRFRLLKFRSMRMGSEGTHITAAADARVTRIGYWLRRYKIDEFPQLWNVVLGQMSLVGPRPEVPLFVDAADPVWQDVLSVRPGITDLASLIYRHEEETLARNTLDVESYYRERILPDKLALNVAYLRSRSWWTDVKIILLTVRYALVPSGFDPNRIRSSFVLRTVS